MNLRFLIRFLLLHRFRYPNGKTLTLGSRFYASHPVGSSSDDHGLLVNTANKLGHSTSANSSRLGCWQSRNFLFGLPAIENIHPSASHRVQCFLREDHRLRASLSGSPKTVQSASRTSFFRHLSIPGGISESFSQVLPQPELSRRKRQRIYPPQHAGKQTPRQMALCQEKPIVPGVLDQSAAGFNQSLLQAGPRPVSDSLWQHQPRHLHRLLAIIVQYSTSPPCPRPRASIGPQAVQPQNFSGEVYRYAQSSCRSSAAFIDRHQHGRSTGRHRSPGICGRGTVKLSSLAAFSPPAATAKSFNQRIDLAMRWRFACMRTAHSCEVGSPR